VVEFIIYTISKKFLVKEGVKLPLLLLAPGDVVHEEYCSLLQDRLDMLK
jgi:hypothetical protein